jgi:hypothetical protein
MLTRQRPSWTGPEQHNVDVYASVRPRTRSPVPTLGVGGGTGRRRAG